MICRNCGELWELDSIHEAIQEQYPEHESLRGANGRLDQARYEEEYFNPMLKKFRSEGCRALNPSATYCRPDEGTAERSAVLGAIADLMGDDADGEQGAIEDAMDLGLL